MKKLMFMALLYLPLLAKAAPTTIEKGPSDNFSFIAGGAEQASLTTTGDFSVTGNIQAQNFVGNGASITNITASPAGASGQIQFNDSGSLGGDSLLFWDNTDKELGIGTSSPNARLMIKDGGLNILDDTGVKGSMLLRVDPVGGNPYIDFRNSADTRRGNIYYDQPADKFRINTEIDLDTILNQNGGNVGIGTSTPTEKLDISGTIRAASFTGDGSGLTGITTSPAGANKEIQFNNSGTLGGAGNLFWDTATTSLGLGITAPTLNDTGRVLHIHQEAGQTAGVRMTNSDTGSTSTDGAFLGVWNTGTPENLLIWNYENTPIRFATNSAERMIISEVGNVGIGQTNPAARLDIRLDHDALSYLDFWNINSNSNAGVNFRRILKDNDDTTNITFDDVVYHNTGAWSKINNHGDAKYIWNFGATEAMRLNNNGRLGIGTSTPSHSLDVYSTARSAIEVHTSGSGADDYAELLLRSDDGTVGGIWKNSSSQNLYGGASSLSVGSPSDVTLTFVTNNAPRMTVLGNGNVGIGTSTPTERLDISGTVKATAFVGDGSGLTGLTADNANTLDSLDSVDFIRSNTLDVFTGTSQANGVIGTGVYSTGDWVGVSMVGPSSKMLGMHYGGTANELRFARYVKPANSTSKGNWEATPFAFNLDTGKLTAVGNVTANSFTGDGSNMTAANPTANNQLATKEYVDTAVAGASGGGINWGDCTVANTCVGGSTAGSATPNTTLTCSGGRVLVDSGCSEYASASVDSSFGSCHLSGVNTLYLSGRDSTSSGFVLRQCGYIKCCATN